MTRVRIMYRSEVRCGSFSHCRGTEIRLKKPLCKNAPNDNQTNKSLNVLYYWHNSWNWWGRVSYGEWRPTWGQNNIKNSRIRCFAKGPSFERFHSAGGNNMLTIICVTQWGRSKSRFWSRSANLTGMVRLIKWPSFLILCSLTLNMQTLIGKTRLIFQPDHNGSFHEKSI